MRACERSGIAGSTVASTAPNITGILLIAVGVVIAAGIRVRLVAILLGIFLLACEALLQVPRAIAAPLDLSIRTTVFEVLSLCSAALTLAVHFPDARNLQ